MRARSRAWAVFISGRGSNLQAILDLAADVDVRLVVTSDPAAAGVLRAKRAGVPVLALPKKIDWDALEGELAKRGIDFVFLAGFMRLVPAAFVARRAGRLLNVHPSLLPSFPGLRALEAGLEAGADLGVTVHVVTAEMDAGPRLLQRRTRRAPEAVTLNEARRRGSRAEQRLVREAVTKWT